MRNYNLVSASLEETKLWGHSIVCISLILGNYENWRALTPSQPQVSEAYPKGCGT